MPELEGFQVTEQLEDHIAIILYSMEPAILSSDSQWNQAVAPERLIARVAPAFSPTMGTADMNKGLRKPDGGLITGP